MRLHELPESAESGEYYFEESVVALAVFGRGTRRFRIAGQVRELRTAPRMLEFWAEGLSLDSARWTGEAGEVIGVHLRQPEVNRLLGTEGRSFRLPTRHEVFDDRLANLLVALWREASQGGQSGRLYAEGLTLAMLGLLQTEHGARQSPRQRKIARFTPAEMSRLRELIADELEHDLSVERLAAEVGRSPYHFLRMFKADFERTPHAYVIEQRVNAAARLLRADPVRSIADIAGECGFASQAHLTESFHKRMGTTPGRWRKN
jgi:AraC family transcriptional regulator